MKIWTVKIGSSLNAETTKGRLVALASKAKASIEFFPARRYENAEIMVLNGRNVAYLFQSQADAVLYAGSH